MRILIVDDEFVSRMKMQKLVAPYGSYDFAVNGKEAILAYKCAIHEGHPYDLITMDISMPDFSGIEVLQKIRRLEEEANIRFGHGTKVLMVTAANDAAAVMASYREGCEAYICKPFNKEQVLEALDLLQLNQVNEDS